MLAERNQSSVLAEEVPPLLVEASVPIVTSSAVEVVHCIHALDASAFGLLADWEKNAEAVELHSALTTCES